MEESILYPSPNWFLPSVLAVSKDGWLMYGAPGNGLVVLEPLSHDLEGVVDSKYRHKVHSLTKPHRERVVAVDISPQWPEKRQFVSGSCDGTVKVWSITADVDNKWVIKNTHSHEVHANEKEEVVSVGYNMATHVISVGNFSIITKWELNTNVTKSYNHLMRSFKATCMSCSPHLEMIVAVGTKQGVVFVLDLTERGKIVYKVRCQDDEVGQIAWCPQYEVTLKRSLEVKKSVATLRMDAIRKEPEHSNPDDSGINKTLPNDSFDESMVQEDDMFDIYKDHEADEFGHKKYQPEEIVVKKKDEAVKNDFLAECERLKAQILKNKEEDDEPIANLVEAMDKAHLKEEKVDIEESKTVSGVAKIGPSGSTLVPSSGSDHIHKHLLASISKNGSSVRIWSKTGKLVASCAVLLYSKTFGKQTPIKLPQYATLCWYKPNSLVISDGKVNWVECNPLAVDCRNRLKWTTIPYVHRRGLYCIVTTAPRVQTPDALESQDEDEWCIWTVAQDRFLIKYSLKDRKVLARYSTCGAPIYDVRPCPYDAGKLAISVGDGAVRIVENRTSGEAENKLTPGEVISIWQNVQGKILQTAWHPTRENLLAFATAESRVGLIDISKTERTAKVLQTALRQGVYSIAWGDKMTLFAVGGRELVMYQANKPDQAPIPIHIEIEGQKWDPCVVSYSPRGLTVAACNGGVALFSGPGGQARAAKFVFTRMIHSIEWHPIQTSSSDEESKYMNLLAISSAERTNAIVIIQYEDKEGGGKQFSNYTTLSGHTNLVLQIYWNPHRDGQLLSTSLDQTVRVWDAINGVCVSIFAGHSGSSLGAAWCPQPQLADCVLSGGNDCALRLWNINQHPPQNYKEVKTDPRGRRRNKKNITFAKVEDDKVTVEEVPPSKEENEKEVVKNYNSYYYGIEDESEEEMASDIGSILKKKVSRRFIMPIVARQLNTTASDGPRSIIQKYIENHTEIKSIVDLMKDESTKPYDTDFVKMFGSINDVNEVLDKECASHLELHAYTEYMMLMIFRGHIDSVIQFANEHDLLCPFLLSIAPSVSFKYWKDVMQLYIAQIDRLEAKVNVLPPPLPESVEEESATQVKNMFRATMASRYFGGPAYRKAAALLSLHDVKGAVAVLEKAWLFKEAYILCRCRHMDSVAAETLAKWASHASNNGELTVAAVLYITIGDISHAANVLRRSVKQDLLHLAAELAKIAGHNTFADFIETKAKNAEPTQDNRTTEEQLADLPTRIELLMSENNDLNGEAYPTTGDESKLLDESNDKVQNEDCTTEDQLADLPTKMELLMRGNKDLNGEPDQTTGDKSKLLNESNDKVQNEYCTTDEQLADLPTKMELLMRKNKDLNGEPDQTTGDESKLKNESNDKVQNEYCTTEEQLADLPTKMEFLMRKNKDMNGEPDQTTGDESKLQNESNDKVQNEDANDYKTEVVSEA